MKLDREVMLRNKSRSCLRVGNDSRCRLINNTNPVNRCQMRRLRQKKDDANNLGWKYSVLATGWRVCSVSAVNLKCFADRF